MLFRFGVVLPARMTEGGGSLLVAGSRPELGGWDPQRALPMQPARPTAPLPAQEPALWLAEVALPDEDAASPFWYKFLRRQGGELLWEGNGRAVRPVGGERSGWARRRPALGWAWRDGAAAGAPLLGGSAAAPPSRPEPRGVGREGCPAPAGPQPELGAAGGRLPPREGPNCARRSSLLGCRDMTRALANESGL